MCRILILADIRPMGYNKLSCWGSFWSRYKDLSFKSVLGRCDIEARTNTKKKQFP